MRKTEQGTLNRLWETLLALGVQNELPRQGMQLMPLVGDGDATAQRNAYLVESLFTGLYTSERDTMLRCWVQAHGYAEVLKATGHNPGAYLCDRVTELRGRVEGHFLRGEV